ncbi:hypothetical protein BS78_10G089900 [Paspalum vaginatum]|nr:hypothetical protein BS78_10G089900 [Paspalum vaginatum]
MRIRARAPATSSKKRRPRGPFRPPTTARQMTTLAALPLLLLLGAPAAAQAPSRGTPPQSSPPPGFSTPMVVLLVALIAAFLFIGFFSVFMRRCGRGAAPGGPVIPAAALLALARHEQRSQRRGLDPAVVASFPTMRYAEAKELRVGGKDAALECAVCLSEFEDDEELRLLPACSHAFHPDCIGEWLAGHVTCPVCRCNLDPEEVAAADEAAVSSGEEVGSGTGDAEEQRDQVVVSIDVSRGGAGEEEEEEEERRREAAELDRIGSQRRAVRWRSRSERVVVRSRSTGHSLAAPRVDGGGDLERFTLRLPEHVRREMVAAAGEESLSRTGPRGGSNGSRSARSDRWPSLIARTLSSRVPFWSASRRAPDAAEAAAGTGTTTTTTERTSKREKAGAASDGSLTPPKGSVRFDCLGAPAVSGARVGAAAGDSEAEDDDEEKAIAPHRQA